MRSVLAGLCHRLQAGFKGGPLSSCHHQFLSLLLVTLVCSSTAPEAHSQQNTAVASIAVVIKGDDNYPPYSFFEDGRMRGIYTDIIQAIAPHMPGYTIETKAIPWKRGLLELAQGELFALYPPYHRPNERPYMDYSEPLFREQLFIYCNDSVESNSPLAPFPETYFGLNVGINLGFLSSPTLHQANKHGKLRLVATGSTNRNLMLLLSYRIDCYVNDQNAILYSYQRIKHDHRQLLNAGEFPAIHPGPMLSEEFGYLGVSKHQEHYPYARDFVKKFNRALLRIQASGEVDQIFRRYVPIDQ